MLAAIMTEILICICSEVNQAIGEYQGKCLRFTPSPSCTGHTRSWNIHGGTAEQGELKACHLTFKGFPISLPPKPQSAEKPKYVVYAPSTGN